MERRLHVGLGDDAFHDLRDGWDPNDLLHPAQAQGVSHLLTLWHFGNARLTGVHRDD
jgi:hypothetical protein